MSKHVIGEKVVFDERGMIVGKTVDVSHSLRNAERLRETKATPMADSVCVGTMDANMFYALAQRAGVDLTDHLALEDFATRLFQGGGVAGLDGRDFNKFRVYEGTV